MEFERFACNSIGQQTGLSGAETCLADQIRRCYIMKTD
jgi:hypothetical protein